MFGVVVSAVWFGYLSDKFGRIRVLYAAILLEIAGGFCSIYSPNVICFTLSRFLLSFGGYGRNLTGFMIGIESVGPKYRAKVGIGYQLGWALGYVMLPGIAYLCRDYVTLFYCTTVPELFWLVWLWRIPESPKWLISKAKYEEAEKVLKNALKYNGKSLENVKEQMEALRHQIERERLNRAGEREITFFDLWRNKNIRNFTMILYFTWSVRFEIWGLMSGVQCRFRPISFSVDSGSSMLLSTTAFRSTLETLAVICSSTLLSPDSSKCPATYSQSTHSTMSAVVN